MGKDFMIGKVVEQLRPNAYTEDSVVWNTVVNSLSKLNNKELSGLHALLLAKHERMVLKKCLGCEEEKVMLDYHGYCNTCKGEDFGETF